MAGCRLRKAINLDLTIQPTILQVVQAPGELPAMDAKGRVAEPIQRRATKWPRVVSGEW